MASVLVGTAAVGGLGLAAVGQIQAGRAAAAEAKGAETVAQYNARVATQQAKAEEQYTKIRQEQQAEDAARHASALQAGLSASGAVPSDGTPLLIQARQAAESELDNLMIGYEGQIRAQRASSQAELDRLQGQIYGQRTGYAKAAGMTGAGATLLTGFTGLAGGQGWGIPRRKA